jgi:hypothetical protein
MRESFQRYIGIDYSGRAEPTVGTPAIRVYEASPAVEPKEVHPCTGRHWSRKELADWLTVQLADGPRALVGIDHAFSFPAAYMLRHRLTSWPAFLADFVNRWPTDRKSVESLRRSNRGHGRSNEFRLADRWTSSAKSVFLFDVNGSVAKSTHSGLPWLLRIREECGDKVFFWPFDGWDPPPGKHVIAEVYPSLFRNRYRDSGLEGDQLDAYAVAAWMRDMAARDALDRYFHPPLTLAEKKTARLEGWILGVS